MEEILQMSYVSIEEPRNKCTISDEFNFPEGVKEILKERSLPDLVLTILGDSNDFLNIPWKKSKFKKAILETARCTSACWFLHGSANDRNLSISSVIDQAMKEHKLINQGEINDIERGDAHNGREFHNGIRISCYPSNEETILITVNGEDDFVDTLLKLEKCLHTKHMYLQCVRRVIQVPVIIVLAEGGIDALKHVSAAIKENFPVVVIRGSGKAADIIASYLEDPQSISIVIANFFGRLYVEGDLFRTVKLLLENIYRKRWLISIFDFEKNKPQDFAEEIAKIISNSWCPKDMNDNNEGIQSDDDEDNIENLLDKLPVSGEIFVYYWYLELQKNNQLHEKGGTRLLQFLWRAETMRSLLKILLEEKVPMVDIEELEKVKFHATKIKEYCSNLVGYSQDTHVQNSGENYRFSKDSFQIYDYLIFCELLNERTDMVEMIWSRCENPIMTALIASTVLSKMADKKFKSKDKDAALRFSEAARTYERYAVRILDNFLDEKGHKYTRIADPVDVLNIKTCPLEFAYYTKRMDFLSHTCCVKYMDSIWTGRELCEDNKEKLCCKGIMKKLKSAPHLITLPRTKFILHYVFNMLAIICFCIFCMTDVKGIRDIKSIYDVSPWQLVFTVWLFGDLVEEILCEFILDKFDKLSIDKEKAERLTHSFKVRIKWWFFDVWNIMDILAFLWYIAAVLVNVLHQETTDESAVVRRMYTVSIILLYARFLRVMLISSNLGSKIIIIGQMILDLLRFLVIMAVIILGCGVAYHMNLYPNDKKLFSGWWYTWRIWYILWFPYWQTYGDNLMEVFKSEREYICNQNVTQYDLQKDNDECEKVDWLLTSITAVFMMFSNLLLVNLIIAIFTNRFEKVHANSEKFWNYVMVSLTMEYRIKQPSPINFVTRPIQLVLFLIGKLKSKEKTESDNIDSSSGEINRAYEGIQTKQQVKLEKERHHAKDILSRTQSKR